MKRVGTWMRKGLLLAGAAVLLLWTSAGADHLVTFSQTNSAAGGTAILGTATSGTLSTHWPVGVWGRATAATGTTTGVYGFSSSTSGAGVRGVGAASSGFTFGVYGMSFSPNGVGVRGEANNSAGVTSGVYGFSSSTSGRGVFGYVPAASGSTYGVYGRAASSSGRGVFGWATATSGPTAGVHGLSYSTGGSGVYGVNTASSGTAFGIYGFSSSTNGRGVYGLANAGSGTTTGVYGLVYSTSGTGVRGLATASSGPNYGVYGSSQSLSGAGIFGVGSNGALAGRFTGNVYVSGNFTVTGVKNFVQPHPTQRGKEIVYVALEGPEAGTYIRGTARLVRGQAIIDLPEHFALVTADEGLTVQLTPMGAWQQLYVEKQSPRRIIVREAQRRSGQFAYLVHGIRKGYTTHQVIRRTIPPAAAIRGR